MLNKESIQVLLFLTIVLALVKPVGIYIYHVLENKPCFLDKLISPIERFVYKVCGIDNTSSMDWKKYLYCMLFFNMIGMLWVYFVLRLQSFLPFNPEHFANVSPDLAFNTAASFVSNTNWQAYSGESTLSYFSQMTGLTVQNFLSSATGLALFAAFVRGIRKNNTNSLGNYWVDMTRGILYILLPLAFIFAVFLTSQGVIQNLKPYQKATLIQSTIDIETKEPVTEQIIPMGPVASQVAIKQIGTNGGGFFNTNSAHPFENPNIISNFFEMLAIILLPAALCYTYGIMVRDRKQGIAVLIAMLMLFIPMMLILIAAEHQITPTFQQMEVIGTGNMEGKETRFGITNSTLWTSLTTATSSGSVNSMLDSYTPIGGAAALWLMHLGEVTFGGLGSGLYGMLMIIIVTVFGTGLMVGRTPEFLGKKIEPYEMKMASITVLFMPLLVLLLTSIASVLPSGTNSITNPGPHGFTQILYAITSACNNNGSSFEGLVTNTNFYNIVTGVAMLLSRYWVAIPLLATAGALAKKKISPPNAGTLPTVAPLFIVLIVADTLLIGALSFFSVLSLGPIAEYFMLWGQ